MGKLDEYRRKRKFDRTPEPPGPEPGKAEAASRAVSRERRGKPTTRRAKQRDLPLREERAMAQRSRSGRNDKTSVAEKDLPATAGATARGKPRRLPKPMPKLRLEVRPTDQYGNTFVVQKHSPTPPHHDSPLPLDRPLPSPALPNAPSPPP